MNRERQKLMDQKLMISLWLWFITVAHDISTEHCQLGCG